MSRRERSYGEHARLPAISSAALWTLLLFTGFYTLQFPPTDLSVPTLAPQPPSWTDWCWVAAMFTTIGVALFWVSFLPVSTFLVFGFGTSDSAESAQKKVRIIHALSVPVAMIVPTLWMADVLGML